MLLSLLILYSAICFYLTQKSSQLAKHFGIVDNPNSAPNRKFQSQPIPLIGLLGVCLSNSILMSLLWLCLKYNWFELSNYLNRGLFFEFRLYWILIGGLIIFLAGCFDDKYQLKPKIYFSSIAFGLTIAIIFGGLKIEAFSYPFDNFYLKIGYLPQILAFLWIGACLTATKFLDGHDGLVASVGIVSFLSIAAIASLPSVNQPLIVTFSLLWASGLIGFLWFNFPNAKVYLGDGGSTIIGFTIGVLSILSGAKIATSSTVVGWFILDIVLVMLVRITKYKNLKAIFVGDANLHWHHRLKQLGLNKLQVLVVTGLVISITAQIGTNINTQNKIYVFVTLVLVLVLVFFISLLINSKKASLNSLKKDNL